MPDELLQEYMANHDPVRNFEEYLLSEGVATKDDIDGIAQRVEAEFDEGYAFALASPFPEPATPRKGSGSRTAIGRASPRRRHRAG